jgi:class 3 adenylate cyclase
MLIRRNTAGDNQQAIDLIDEARELAGALAMKALSEKTTQLTRRAAVAAGSASAIAAVGDAQPVARDRTIATLMFVDVVASTELAASIGDRRWSDVLTAYHQLVRRKLELFAGREISNAGDGFLATFDRPAQAIQAACAVRDEVRQLGLEVRSGMHTGECEWVRGNPVGIAVHIGARIGSIAGPGEVFVSSTVHNLVSGALIKFASLGHKSLKGIPGEWEIFRVESLG